MAAGQLARHDPHPWLQAQWQARLERLDQAALAAEMRRLADVGEQGTPVLVAALSAETERVARAANEALGDEVVRWELLDAPQAKRRWRALLAALVSAAPTMTESARRDALALAERGLTIDFALDPAEELQWTADLEHALRALLAGPRGRRTAARAADPTAPHHAAGEPDAVAGDRLLEELADLPGGALRVAPAQVPPRADTEAAAAPDDDDPVLPEAAAPLDTSPLDPSPRMLGPLSARPVPARRTFEQPQSAPGANSGSGQREP
jgi:hypothetical protein